MPLPNEKISTGIDNSAGATNRFESFKSAPNNVKDVVESAHNFTMKTDALLKRLDMIENDVDGKSTEISIRWNQSEHLSKSDRENFARQETENARRDIVDRTDSERWTILRELKTEHDRIIASESLFQSPIHILATTFLGTEELSRYQSQIANCGIVALTNYANQSVAENSPILASAVLNRMDTLSPEELKNLPFTRSELGDAHCGEDYAKVVDAFTKVRKHNNVAFNRNKALQDNKANPASKIAAALLKTTGASDLQKDE